MNELDEESLRFADDIIELQELLTNINNDNIQKTAEKVLKTKFAETDDGISTIVENIPCIISIRPNIVKAISKFCITFIDLAKFGTPAGEFGKLLLDRCLTVVSEDNYLSKIPELLLLKQCVEDQLFSSRDYIPVITRLYEENFYNQFLLMFLIMARDLKQEAEEFYESIFPLLDELLESGFIDYELVPIIKNINEYRSNNWRILDFGVKLDREVQILTALRKDDVNSLKKISFEPNMQLTFTIFEPCKILRNDPTIIQTASFLSAYECFKFLRTIGSKFHNKDSHDHSIGIYIASGGDTRIINEIERLNITFHKALPYCAEYRQYETFEWILAKRSKDIEVNKELRNVLVNSARSNNFRTFMNCLERGQKPRNRDRNNENSLIAASKSRFYYFAQFVSLFESIDLNGVDNEGRSPLMIAAKNGDYDLVSLFIDDGVEFSKRDNNGMTAFMIACGEGHLPVVKLLADYVKEANDKDKEGKTALHHACMHNFWKIVEFLLSEFNMDQSIKDNTGKTAKMYCTDAEVLNLLL